MGLFSNLNLGGTLSGVLSSLQSAAVPAMVNAVLEQTQYHDSTAWSPRWKRAGSGRRCSPGSATAATCRSPRIS